MRGFVTRTPKTHPRRRKSTTPLPVRVCRLCVKDAPDKSELLLYVLRMETHMKMSVNVHVRIMEYVPSMPMGPVLMPI